MNTLREASVASRFQWVSDSADAQIDALVYELYAWGKREKVGFEAERISG